MPTDVVLQPVQQKKTIIVIMSGQLTANYLLTEQTERKLEQALAAGIALRHQYPPRPHSYMLPDCSRHESGGQRVCDVLRLKILAEDPYCDEVIVPDADAELLTEKQRTAFFYKIKASIKGDYIMFL